MFLMILIAIACFILGLLFIFDMNTLKKIEAVLNKTVIKLGGLDEKKGKIFGALLVIYSVVLVILALNIKK